ncbi:MAG: hypothetical protein EPN48_17865 [Microbacteriaceae bacterium]|nr:MAG: hypothetical protein EPN48_17865 [Microbacteriaceae bacterium]
MKTIQIATAGVLALALTGVGVGAALASTPSPSASGAASHAVNTTVHPAVQVSTTSDTADGPEAATAEQTGNESSTANDGPGGHVDPDGVDVNHQGGAGEQ